MSSSIVNIRFESIEGTKTTCQGRGIGYATRVINVEMRNYVGEVESGSSAKMNGDLEIVKRSRVLHVTSDT